MPRYRSRGRSPVRRSKHYDDPRDHRRKKRSPAPSGLLVRNISLSARPEDLRVPFERYGPIKDVYLPKNYYIGDHGARDDYLSPRRSRSISKSVSPRNDRDHKYHERSPRHSRSVTRSHSPRHEKNHRPSLQSSSPAGNGRTGYVPASTSQSPRRNSKNPARSLFVLFWAVEVHSQVLCEASFTKMCE